MAKKMPTASTDVSTLPRRSDFAEGAGGDDEWCREIEKKSDNYGKACRAKTTSDEHDMYFEFLHSLKQFGNSEIFLAITLLAPP